MGNRTALYSRQQPGGVFTIDDFAEHPGNIWHVNSSTTGATDGAGYGQNPNAPFATWDYAYSKCSVGDVIYIGPGHTETWSTSANHVTVDVASVKTIGLGNGSSRPTFTLTHTGATISWTAGGCSIENLLFVSGVDSITTVASISGADATIKNCEVRDTTDVEVITDFTVTGDRLMVDGLFHNGYTSGNAHDCVLALNGVDRAEIKNSRFICNSITAIIEFVSNACTAIEIHDCDFLETGTTDFSKNVVDTVTGSTWSCYNAFDLAAGASFSGGSGASLAGDDVSAALTQLTSSATSVGTAQRSTTASVGTAQRSTAASSAGSTTTALTSSATSVGTATTSVGTAQRSTAASSAGSTTTAVTSSATSVGTAQRSTAASSAGSVGTALTSSATSVGTAVGSVGTQDSTNISTAASVALSGITSWGTYWDGTQYSYLVSAVVSVG